MLDVDLDWADHKKNCCDACDGLSLVTCLLPTLWTAEFQERGVKHAQTSDCPYPGVLSDGSDSDILNNIFIQQPAKPEREQVVQQQARAQVDQQELERGE